MNSKVESDVRNAAIPSEVYGFRKASDLKPLKRLKSNLDRRITVKLKPIKSISLDNYSEKDSQSSIKCSSLKVDAQTVSKDVHDRKKSGERSSLGDHDNAYPGDPVGVKDVANVVVKYLSPYLKQGSIVSKVTVTTETLNLCRKPREDCGEVGRTHARPSYLAKTFSFGSAAAYIIIHHKLSAFCIYSDCL